MAPLTTPLCQKMSHQRWRAYRLQADKDNAQLRMKEDEIELLRTQLSVQSKTRSGESAAAKLSASGEQQAYAIGASMGSEAPVSYTHLACGIVFFLRLRLLGLLLGVIKKGRRGAGGEGG